MRDHDMGYADWKRFRAKSAVKRDALLMALTACVLLTLLTVALAVKANGGARPW